MKTQLTKWTRPQYYVGAEWPEYYVFLGQNRDSDALARSNFQSALKAIGGETTVWIEELGKDVDQVLVVRESHWACGWVEWIGIHESAVEIIAEANSILESLDDYPVVDEEDFSRVEDEECAQTWSECFDASDRLEYFRKHSYTAESIVDLFKAIRGDWGYAANMLHCPSDLLY